MVQTMIELANLERYNEYCLLNMVTGEASFSNTSELSGFTGLYFRDDDTFFAIYPTASGPTAYYRDREYRITPELAISLEKDGKDRRFRIGEYGIEIDYRESPYIGFDAWSDEIDVDLFFMIEQRYREQGFYDRYTLDD